MPDLTSLLPELDAAVREAGRLAIGERPHLSRELKPDGTVVTSADRRVEEFLRIRLPELVDAPIWGEEFGHAVESESGLWVVDPIDGTTNFACGSPLWGVSVGLVCGAQVELGAIALPDLDETYLAARGGGSTCNGEPLPPIPPGPVLPHEIVGYCETVARRFPGVPWPGKMRCAGSFVIEGAFVARQRYRGMVGIREKLYDIAAAVVINSELGADVRYADGEPFELEPLKADVKIERPWIIFPAGSGFFVGDG